MKIRMSVPEFFVCYECNNWYLDKVSCNTHMLNCLIQQDLSTITKDGFSKPKRRKKSRKIHKPSKMKRVIASTICDICQVKFAHTSSLNIHKMRKHSDSRRDFSCVTCGKDFKTKADLGCHQKSHKEKIKCSYCDFQATPYVMKRHMQTVHLGQKDKVCEECGKQFKDVALIYKHKVTVHMKIKSFQCDNCEFVCGTVSNLNLHRIKIHQSKDRLSILSDFKTSYKESLNNAKCN